MKKHTDSIETEKHLIDLHMHTTNSDGAEPPEVVINQAKAAGLSLIAVTDQDSLLHREGISYCLKK